MILARPDCDTKICISIAQKPGQFGSRFHNNSYRKLCMNWIYIPRKVDEVSVLGDVLNSLLALGIKGCSVSMPFKQKSIQYLDEVDDRAKIIGAINTIKVKNDTLLKGYNTDYIGAKQALSVARIEGRRVLMLGAGGVAQAIGLAAIELGGRLTVANRTYERAKELGEKLDAEVISWEEVNKSFAHLLINATSVGMMNPNEMVVKEEAIQNFDVVMDTVIYPAETRLLRSAKEKGKEIIPGTLMCVYQAAAQFKIYTGFNAPKEVVERTIETFEQ